ncbi:hypothetical protein POM88_016843 [Heracleum sosnowskyi]|uniref:Uncharacterized protein n=1 Tax=Heracleum sosnowskyi TaxID=360622 RepID=A0AAD8MTC9_9APIA|nr:hypothetical protein POM88_016843 [Heracleum sosnowskyi]
MARFSHHNILKLNKTKLKVRVMQAFSYDYRPFCTSCFASPLHVTFHTHIKQQFLEPHDVEEEKNSRDVVETVLGSLGLKKSMSGRVFKEVMAFGRRYESAGKEKKKGLVVVLTVVQTCIGERVGVHEAVEKSYQESSLKLAKREIYCHFSNEIP